MPTIRRQPSRAAAAPPAAPEIDLSIVEQTVGFLIRIAQVEAFQAFSRATGEYRPATYAVLAIISANPGIRQGVIAQTLGFREPNMSKLIKELTAAGVVKKAISGKDRRAAALALTRRGQTLVNDLNEVVLALDQRYTASLSASERDALMAALKKVIADARRA